MEDLESKKRGTKFPIQKSTKELPFVVLRPCREKQETWLCGKAKSRSISQRGISTACRFVKTYPPPWPLKNGS